MAKPTKTIEQSLDEWLTTEGYPLEYFTAAVFRSHGFDVMQGKHARSGDEDPREIDVVAQMSFRAESRLIRLVNVIECKWSMDAPWVVFTHSRGPMATSACIAQTIGSDLGDALLWMISASEVVQSLELFRTPESPGFGGRKAHSRADAFYGASAAVISKCRLLVERFDRRARHSADNLPQLAEIAFPVIVIHGRLFEASYDPVSDKMLTKEVQNSRCHWDGAPSWPLFATIDIVTKDGLARFAQQRVGDMQVVAAELQAADERLQRAAATRDLNALELGSAPTGRGAPPKLLRSLRKAIEQPKQ